MKTLKKTLCLVLAVVLAVGVLVIPANADRSTWNGFTDKDKANVKYEEALGALTGMGIINGRDDKLEPDAYVTRTEAVIMIVRALMGGSTWTVPQAATKFADVPATHYASGYVAYAVSFGIVAGKSDTEFKPDDLVTGYELAKMALVAAQIKSDFNPSVWQIESASNAFRKGLLVGLENIKDLNKALTREEAAQLIWNAVKYDEVVNNVHTGIGRVNFSLATAENPTDDMGRPAVRYYNSKTNEVYYEGTRQGVVDFYVDGEYLTAKTLREKLGLSNCNGLTAKIVVNGNEDNTITDKDLSKDDTKLLTNSARGAHVYVYNGLGDDTYDVYVSYTYAAYFKDASSEGVAGAAQTGFLSTKLGFAVSAKDVAIFDFNSGTGKAVNAKLDSAVKTGVTITRKSNTNNDRYVYLDGVKTNLSAKAIVVDADGTVEPADIDPETANIVVSKTAKYNVFYDNAGNILAIVAQAAAPVEPSVLYDGFGYILSFSSVAHDPAHGGDMNYNQTNEIDAKARVLMVDLKTGTVSVYELNVVKSGTQYYAAGVDGKANTSIEITADVTNQPLHTGYVAFKKFESGSFGISAISQLNSIGTTNQGYVEATTTFTTNKNGLITVDGRYGTWLYGNGSTVVTVLNGHTFDADNSHVKAYTAVEKTGYTTLDAITANYTATCATNGERVGTGALFVYDSETNIVTKAYVFAVDNAPAPTPPAADVYDYYMYLGAGDTTVDGTELSFFHNGVKETIASSKLDTDWTTLTIGNVYVGTTGDDGKITLAAPVAETNYSAAFTTVTGYVNESGTGFVAMNNTVYALAGGYYMIDSTGTTDVLFTGTPKDKTVKAYFADSNKTTIALLVIEG